MALSPLLSQKEPPIAKVAIEKAQSLVFEAIPLTVRYSTGYDPLQRAIHCLRVGYIIALADPNHHLGTPISRHSSPPAVIYSTFTHHVYA